MPYTSLLVSVSSKLYLNLLALRMEDSRLEASSRAMIAAMEKSVAEPAALLLAGVVVVALAATVAAAVLAGPALTAGGRTPLHR